MAIGVKKNKQIASPLGLTISPQTVAKAEAWKDVSLPVIPAEDPFSPNRATGKASTHYSHYEYFNNTLLYSLHVDVDDPQKNSNQDFENTLIHVEFLPDQYFPVNDLSADVSIIDDDINEAYEEFFVVRLDPAVSGNKLLKFNGPRVSLCKIVDNDRKCTLIATCKLELHRHDNIICMSS